jgi:hypothetical protein
MKKLKVGFAQRIGRYKVVTLDLLSGVSLETVRDTAAKQVGLDIGSESVIGGFGIDSISEQVRMAHIRALKAKWPDLTDRSLATTMAAGRASESREKRLAFIRKALKLKP